jgi:glyoxylase-like metal-dependent hydrolase (beta-lactamase superfamily II)
MTTSKPDSAPVMLGMEMPSVDRWSERVVVALGQNPSAFTGPGTNTYLVGSGEERILLDTGDGRAEYLPVLEAAMEQAGCRSIQEIVLTHGHPDHVGGVASVMKRFGRMRVTKMTYEPFDAPHDFEFDHLDDDGVVATEGATLRSIFTPGHSPDHHCFLLEEERSLFTGDNVLGVGTTVIPTESGDLGQYMQSLERLSLFEPGSLYPAHGPMIEDGPAKLHEYIEHRLLRERQILDAMAGGARLISEMVSVIYAAYPKTLHAAAGQSVGAHILKLEGEQRIHREGDADAPPSEVSWRLD